MLTGLCLELPSLVESPPSHPLHQEVSALDQATKQAAPAPHGSGVCGSAASTLVQALVDLQDP